MNGRFLSPSECKNLYRIFLAHLVPPKGVIKFAKGNPPLKEFVKFKLLSLFHLNSSFYAIVDAPCEIKEPDDIISG